MSSSQEPDQSEVEDRTAQPGFVRTVLQVFSGSRFRTPESPKTFGSRRDENRQGDRAHLSGLTSDEVVLTKEIPDDTTPLDEGLSKSFRYNDGSPTLTNGGPSSGFRYFKNDEKMGHAVGVSQGKGLMSSLPSPMREQGKMDNFLSDLSSFPLSRPVAGYVSDHSKEPP
jgi:hypothetical protein